MDSRSTKHIRPHFLLVNLGLLDKILIAYQGLRCIQVLSHHPRMFLLQFRIISANDFHAGFEVFQSVFHEKKTLQYCVFDTKFAKIGLSTIVFFKHPFPP